jgi:hypothetical protein
MRDGAGIPRQFTGKEYSRNIDLIAAGKAGGAP